MQSGYGNSIRSADDKEERTGRRIVSTSRLAATHNKRHKIALRDSVSKMIQFITLQSSIVFVGLIYGATTFAQTFIDDGVCGCSPQTFTFNLDFSLTCPPTNITSGGGVAAVSCIVSPFGASSDDLTPIVVESVSVLELDQSNSVLVEERIVGNLLDGDTFTYTSVIDNTESITSLEQIPKAIQLNLNGRNMDGVVLLNVFIITYSNECGVIPVIRDEYSAGWVIFTEHGEIESQFCPTPQPTQQPTVAPTNDPTFTPTPEPTIQPSHTPIIQPTLSLNTSEPTRIPTTAPTIGPPGIPPTTPNPTSQRHTSEPSPGPATLPVTLSPSHSPGSSPVNDPTQRPPSLTDPLTPTGASSAPSTSEATIEPSGVASSAIPTIISRFPTIDMSMSMRLNFPWGDKEELRSSLFINERTGEKRLDLLREYVND
ncbi:filamentous hemagglutinin family domain containing protein [Nitzschia inconspicua]|uniref:Filamentous hemagglutinin family domain containing protein n=1 Tax=Nitzschia inconspicua TaxID=303405 RepID=A0A9K3PNZ3_9STRA|nr:filamentous hemagglutinin family domain containing protein [Nitzschia inconspicua]